MLISDTLTGLRVVSGVALGLAATVDDLRRRRIANWIPLTLTIAGLVLDLAIGGLRGLASFAIGTLCGGALFLVFYLLGGMGAGDIKLMAGFGALLGARQILLAGIIAAIVGGLIAALTLGITRIRRKQSPLHIPYAPAITAGALLVLISNPRGGL